MYSLLVRTLLIFTIFIISTKGPVAFSAPASEGPKCVDDTNALIKQRKNIKPTTEEAWNKSQKTLGEFKKKVAENESLILNEATSLLARGYIMLTGAPGGAKTMTARQVLEAEIRGLGEAEKEIFTRTMHQLVQEGAIIGNLKVEEYLKGKLEYERSTSLNGDKFILWLLDEFEKSLPNVQTKLLSLMAENRVMLGSEVVDAFTRAGIATSNKNQAAMISSYPDRSTAEAVLDRFIIKHHVGNKIVDDKVFVRGLARPLLDQRKNSLKYFQPEIPQAEIKKAEGELETAFTDLYPLVEKVEIPDNVIDAMSKIIFDFDGAQQAAVNSANEGQEKVEAFAGNQFTNRSNKALLLKTLRARFLLHQMDSGVAFKDIRFQMEPKDLVHLHSGALEGGPGMIVQDPATGVIKDDGFLAKYAEGPHKKGEKKQVQWIGDRRNELIGFMNKHIPEAGPATQAKRTPLVLTPTPTRAPKSLKEAYDFTQNTVRNRMKMFTDLDYAQESLGATMIGGHNLIAFGGPGSAKSLTAEVYSSGELKGTQIFFPGKDFNVFKIQFDKQTPSGVLSGVLNYEERLKSGKEVVNHENSLANKKNIGGVLDELDKAHPGVIAEALSLANPTERSVMNGDTQSTNLRWLLSSSNMTPARMMEKIAGINRLNISTGEAWGDRGTRKVWYLNKQLSADKLAKYLKAVRDGNGFEAEPTYFFLLEDLAKQVEIPNHVLFFARKIWKATQNELVALHEPTLEAHLQDPNIYPDYFAPSTEGSTRSELINIAAAQSGFIMRQLMEGVPYDKLRMTMQLNDLDLFSDTQRHATPAKVVWRPDMSIDSYQLEVQEGLPTGEGLLRLSKGDQEFLRFEQLALDNWVKSVNKSVRESMVKFRDIISEFPSLFPELRIFQEKKAGAK